MIAARFVGGANCRVKVDNEQVVTQNDAIAAAQAIIAKFLHA